MTASRRGFIAAAAATLAIPLTAAKCGASGGPLRHSELPLYTWDELDIAYPPDDWAHEPTGQYERPQSVPGFRWGWQRAGFLKGTRRQVVIWVRRIRK